MPIRPFLQEAVLDQTAIDAMNAAFNEVLKELGLNDVDDPLVEMVAKTIIECARRGDLDLVNMRECAMKEIGKSELN